jgi:hypothetical protein
MTNRHFLLINRLNLSLKEGKNSTLSLSISSGCQIAINEKFQLDIKIRDSYYEVMVNNNNYCNVNHQKNFQDVTKISVSGCKVYYIEVDKSCLEVISEDKPEESGIDLPEIVVTDCSEMNE